MALHPLALLKKHHLEARKSLGQNFLLPGNGERIARVAGIGKSDWVVEIGPGLGALTEALCDRAEHVIAVDLDKAMIRVLEKELGDRKNLELVHGDARTLDLAEIHARAGRKLKLVGNLPYYASSPLLRHAIDQRAHVSDVTFTLQKEVAERIAASPGGKIYGALTVLTCLWADASVPMKLAPGAFHPKPGVESAVLKLVLRETPRTVVEDFAMFEKVVFAAFAQRRKTIQNSMKDSGLGLPAAGIAEVLAQAGIDPMRRAETVSIEEFGKLYDAVRGRL